MREDPDTIAAFFAEPVMGAGGAILPPAGYFAALQRGSRPLRRPAYRRRGHLRLRPARHLVRIAGHGHAPGHALLRQGGDLGLPAARRRSASTKRSTRRCSTRASSSAPSVTAPPIPAIRSPAPSPTRRSRSTHATASWSQVRAKAPHFQARLAALAEHPLVGEARGIGLIGGLEIVADKPSKRQYEPEGGRRRALRRLRAGRGADRALPRRRPHRALPAADHHAGRRSTRCSTASAARSTARPPGLHRKNARQRNRFFALHSKLASASRPCASMSGLHEFEAFTTS